MALALNTSHPLYANLLCLICVDETNTIIDLVTPSRTFTKHTNATIGSGTYGRHIKTLGSSYSPQGVQLDTPLDLAAPTYTNLSVLVVANNLPTGSNGSNALGNTASATAFFSPTTTSSDASVKYNNSALATSGVTYRNVGPISLVGVRDKTGGAGAFYRDGALVNSGSVVGTDGTSVEFNYIGGREGTGVLQGEYVWIAYFDKALDATEVADLHSSLGADNAFSLVESATPVPVSFSGTVPDQVGTQNSAFSLSLSPYFSGTTTPFSYTLDAGILPTGLALDSETGVISGTPSIADEVQTGIVVLATDSGSNTDSTNSFSITINDEAEGNPAPTFNGPPISDISATQGESIASFSVASLFFDTEALTFSAVGSWPDGVSVSTGGTVSGTPTTAGTYASLQVQATDTASQTVLSNSFAVNVLAPGNPSTVTLTEPLKNNTGTTLANLSGIRAAVLNADTMASVYEQAGLTTDASGTLAPITDVSIVTGQSYHIAIKLADGGVGITGAVIAS